MDFEIGQPTEIELAAQACASCRKQKRRCDKRLPICSLCSRIGRHCDYSTDAQTASPSQEDFAALRDQVSNLEQLLRGVTQGNGLLSNTSNGGSSNDSANGSSHLSHGSSPAGLLTPNSALASAGQTPFPSIFFLDSSAFQYERFQIQHPHVKVPPGALVALGNSAELREMIEHYFSTLHNYFPIISKIRLYQHLANPLHEPGADVALLFLAMKLACSEIPDGMPAQTQLYQDVKSFYNFVEAQNGFSVQIIQALLLIAFYEIGQCIYPAAYLSVGNSARVCYATGLHDRQAPQMLPRCNTWTEQEERRRVWWGVIVLDRFSHIGHRGKPFASPDPSLETHLPTDDASWDRGQMLVAAPLSLSASQTIRVSPFARTCQAAHLLGKVLRHMDDKHLPIDYRFGEALQLHRTMRALADVLPDEALHDDPSLQPSLCTSMAIVYSGLLTLYDGYSCTEHSVQAGQEGGEPQLVMQKESIDGLGEISGRCVTLARKVKTAVDNGEIGRLSPMVVDAIYQAAANYAWYVRESSDHACSERLFELKELLILLDRRWKVAGQYLFIIDDFWSRKDLEPPSRVEAERFASA
ncbi:hypothetical protein LTR37_010295 [Vermiconidia calcicola]|uniref:Uncharacterized protein n=1 Tax=Vermiconidia calcicola TaxID=1690605 RepID=A0ACC3N5C2_9PEZI|nr:hypothetical protein LTR37_010295 [Vermiconidia calcicola]